MKKQKKSFGRWLKQKLEESVDTMLGNLKGGARRLKKVGYSGSIGASIFIGAFNFEISIGVDLELNEVTISSDGIDMKPGSGYLQIYLKEGRNLPAKDKSGSSDPYCTFKCGSNHIKSSVIDKNLNPLWNEYLRMDANINDILRIRAYDFNKLLTKSSMGEQAFNLKQLGMGDGIAREFVVKEGLEQGEIWFKAVFKFYNTEDNKTFVRALLGKDVVVPDSPQLASPTVKRQQSDLTQEQKQMESPILPSSPVLPPKLPEKK